MTAATSLIVSKYKVLFSKNYVTHWKSFILFSLGESNWDILRGQRKHKSVKLVRVVMTLWRSTQFKYYLLILWNWTIIQYKCTLFKIFTTHHCLIALNPWTSQRSLESLIFKACQSLLNWRSKAFYGTYLLAGSIVVGSFI